MANDSRKGQASKESRESRECKEKRAVVYSGGLRLVCECDALLFLPGRSWRDLHVCASRTARFLRGVDLRSGHGFGGRTGRRWNVEQRMIEVDSPLVRRDREERRVLQSLMSAMYTVMCKRRWR